MLRFYSWNICELHITTTLIIIANINLALVTFQVLYIHALPHNFLDKYGISPVE